MGRIDMQDELPSSIQKSVKEKVFKIKIMIFTEGTVLKPPSVFQHFNHESYLPIGNAASLISAWEAQGAEINYLTSRKRPKQIKQTKKILLSYNFPGKYLYYRDKGQKYKDLVELVYPDILIEDDCRSIGGSWQWSITYVKPEIRNNIKSIITREFKGIDELPSELEKLLSL